MSQFPNLYGEHSERIFQMITKENLIVSATGGFYESNYPFYKRRKDPVHGIR